MLIIARRKGDRIKIGDDIELVVTDVSRAGVRLGIVAPANVAIVRGEIHVAAEEANRDAARSHLAAPSAERHAVGDAVVLNPVDFMRESRSSKIDGTRSPVADGQDAVAASRDDASSKKEIPTHGTSSSNQRFLTRSSTATSIVTRRPGHELQQALERLPCELCADDRRRSRGEREHEIQDPYVHRCRAQRGGRHLEAQTAEGALGEVHDVLGRCVSLRPRRRTAA